MSDEEKAQEPHASKKSRPQKLQDIPRSQRGAAVARWEVGDETRAQKLLEHGWTVISPYDGSVRGPHKVKLEDADS